MQPFLCRKRRYLALIGAATILFLQACMLVSGERTSIDVRPDAGNVTHTFLGAEGSEVSTISLGDGEALLRVIAILELQQGEIRLELLNAGGSVAFAVQGRPGDQVSRSGMVRLDENGVLRYRVTARGARDGSYQILYQRVQKNQ
ncbi:MAG: hypothetical protein J7463_00395 [Roseiflexus sp.]|nr:hypothetical protein [Roseiflexus sp.]MBO9336482.1 hypothetical protein [Roseiflexus sp.]MBO9364181.1 hypothetical protein [Roseiflexus sp.]MBO9388518.1 hypothetical protein [Roseiflexus sp.]